MIFSFTVSNYNKTQSSKYEETKPGYATLGFIAAERNAITKFRNEYPANNDENQYLIVKRSMRIS